MEARKPNTRNRGERHPPKERKLPSPPPVPAKRTYLKRKSPSPPPEEPVRKKDHPSLPTTAEKQDAKLPTSTYKTISERYNRRLYARFGPNRVVVVCSRPRSSSRWSDGATGDASRDISSKHLKRRIQPMPTSRIRIPRACQSWALAP